jgi:hypothetical protein
MGLILQPMTNGVRYVKFVTIRNNKFSHAETETLRLFTHSPFATRKGFFLLSEKMHGLCAIDPFFRILPMD